MLPSSTTINGWLLIGISILYISLLFYVAWRGDRSTRPYRNPRSRQLIYGLSLAVYFTSWTFYGAVGRATWDGLNFLPIYLGPLLMFLFGAPLLKRVIFISKRNNSTSIADFIASRYGKSPQLAALVAIIAVIGSVPYIALQLKAIAMGFGVLTQNLPVSLMPQHAWWRDTAWYITLVLSVFTILFGTRHLEATEHHRGMIQAIAFESLIKLAAFVTVGLFAAFALFGDPVNLFRHAQQAGLLATLSPSQMHPVPFLMETLVSMFAIICLPRQFHVMVVENLDYQDFNLARWLMIGFLILASLFVIPIALAGMIAYGPHPAHGDILVLGLPLINGLDWLAVFAFLGGGSAAAAMVIVSSVACATMVSNELIMPALLSLGSRRLPRRTHLGRLVLIVRRVTIVVLLLVAYGFYRTVSVDYSLTAFGLLSFAAIAQFGPLAGGRHPMASRQPCRRLLGAAGRLPGVGLCAAAAGSGLHPWHDRCWPTCPCRISALIRSPGAFCSVWAPTSCSMSSCRCWPGSGSGRRSRSPLSFRNRIHAWSSPKRWSAKARSRSPTCVPWPTALWAGSGPRAFSNSSRSAMPRA